MPNTENYDISFGEPGRISRLEKIGELKVGHKDDWNQFVDYQAGTISPIFLETVRDPVTQELEFMALDNNEPKLCGWAKIGDIIIMPPSSSIGNLINLPQGPVEYGELTTLESEIKGFIHDWTDISWEYERIAANYVMLTWVYDRFSVVPYLRAMGDLGSGKSRFLETVGGLCYRGIKISAATSASLYRLQNMWHGTLILDEADLKDSSTTSEIVKILNLGFELGNIIPRCNQNDYCNVDGFDPFGPKILGTRNRFMDNAFESRCLTEIMQPTRRADIPRVLNDEFKARQVELRNKLLMFRLKRWSEMDSNAPNTINFGDLDPRLLQIASPLAIIINLAAPDYMDWFRDEYLQKYQENIKAELFDSEEGMVVHTILNLQAKHAIGDITYIEIQRNLNSNFGLNLSPQQIGYIVKGLGLKKVGRKKVGIKWTSYIECTDPVLDNLAEKYGYNDDQVTA